MILLFDGSNIAFRAHLAITGLTDRDGHEVGAIYGALKSIRSIIAAFPGAAHAVVAFDTHHSRFRESIYPEYKQHRRKPDPHMRIESYRWQIPRLMDIVRCLVPVVTSETDEADDLMAYLCASRCEQERVGIVTTDKDLYQLIRPNVAILDAFKADRGKDFAVIDEQKFSALMEMPLANYLTYRVLTGDKGDNITHPKGFGDVTAKALIAQYGSLEAILASTDPKILPHVEMLRRNERLMLLNRHLEEPQNFTEVEEQLSQAFVPAPDVALEAMEFLEFKSITGDWHNWSLPFQYLLPTPIFGAANLNSNDRSQMVRSDSACLPGLSGASPSAGGPGGTVITTGDPF